jgi:nucleotide-binding universal stress UspA family protein
MSSEAIIVIIGVTWVAIGLALAVYMGRRGHTAFGWGVIGVVLGPLAVLLAVQAVIEEPDHASLKTVDGGIPGVGSLDVLVGIDGSPEAAAAAVTALDLFASSMRRMTLAAVVDYDRVAGHERELRHQLDREADRVEEEICRRRAAGAPSMPGRCGTVLLTGRPDQALADEAIRDGYDVVIAGARGAGVSKALLGSVASRLASSSKVPVLIAPSDR